MGAPNVIKELEKKARAKDEAHEQKVEAEIQRRKAQELDRSRGESVWFSRRIKDGHLYHWALFTYGKKYELRLPTREKYKGVMPGGRLVGSVVPSFQYETRIVPWSLREEMMRLREESLANEGKPHALNYYICQIGWTKLTEQEVDSECAAASASFGVYVLGFNDCQSFLRQFAKRIIKHPEGCALDYPWFEKNIETPYHELQLVPADEHIKAFQFWLQTSMYGAAGATAGGAYYAVYENTTYYQSQEPMDTTAQSGDNKASDNSREDGGGDADGGHGCCGCDGDGDCCCDCCCDCCWQCCCSC